MSLRGLLPAAIATVTVVSRAASQSPTPALRQRIETILSTKESELIAFRRDLHQHPEVSGAGATDLRAGRRDRLRRLGLEVTTGIGGQVRRRSPRGQARTVDRLSGRHGRGPVERPDPVEFRSLTPGVRHICGHDLHTTIGLALAEALAAVRNDLAGTVMFVFQPAEERATGAKARCSPTVSSPERNRPRSSPSTRRRCRLGGLALGVG